MTDEKKPFGTVKPGDKRDEGKKPSAGEKTKPSTGHKPTPPKK